MTKTELLEHPFWDATNPSRSRLVRISMAFPPDLNPFFKDDVVMTSAGVPGEVAHSKSYMAYEGIKHGIKEGRIDSSTIIVEATSGNTGQAMAHICTALGLTFWPVIAGDVPQDKINAIRIFGKRVRPQLLFESDETTVEYARRLGSQLGYYNPDQYAMSWNWQAHYTYLAPQLWKQQPAISILVVPAGTMGTYCGLAAYVRDNNLGTKVVPVMCAEDEEVPGARTLASIRHDIRQPWNSSCSEEDIQFGTRRAAFYLSYLSWGHVPQQLGPSFGLAYCGAINFLGKHKNAGTLDQFREPDGKVYVVLFGPDDYRPYTSLYFSVLKKRELSTRKPLTMELFSAVNR